MKLTQVQGFHIELTNKCTLKCPACARTKFLDKWPQHWKNHSIDPNDLFNFLDIDLQGKIITLSGNYGDPIYHNNFLDIVKTLKSHGANVYVNTNGSYKCPKFWQDLCDLLTEQDRITFAIDGIPENFTQYRINADWTSIKIALDFVSKSVVQKVWQYIIFSYNQDTVEQAKQISKSFGFDFKIVHSDRYDETTYWLQPDESYINEKNSSKLLFKQGQPVDKINPLCSDGCQHYISADGYYSPCCMVAEHSFYYKTLFGKQKRSFAINETSFSSVLDLQTTQEFYSSLPNQPVCQFNCPS
mgnify:CR=1 FL=1